MSSTVIFRVRSPPSTWGSTICLTGSSTHLTSWSLNQTPPLPLSFSAPYFSLSLSLPANSYFEYKYVSVTDNAIASWEQLPHGGNRHLQTPPPGYRVLVDDGEVGSDGARSQQLFGPVASEQAGDEHKAGGISNNTDDAELALELRRTTAVVEGIRRGVRRLKAGGGAESEGCAEDGKNGSGSGSESESERDGEAKAQGEDGGAAEGYWVVEGCVRDGYALVEALREARGGGNKRTGVGAFVAAMVMGFGMLVVAAVVASPRLGDHGWQWVHGVCRTQWQAAMAGGLRAQLATATARFLSRVTDAGRSAEARVAWVAAVVCQGLQLGEWVCGKGEGGR